MKCALLRLGPPVKQNTKRVSRGKHSRDREDKRSPRLNPLHRPLEFNGAGRAEVEDRKT